MLKNLAGQIPSLAWPPIPKPEYKTIEYHVRMSEFGSYLGNDSEENEKSRWNNLLAKNFISFSHFVLLERVGILSLLFV